MCYLDSIQDDTSEETRAALELLETKRLAAIAYLGEKWVLHANNAARNNGSNGHKITAFNRIQ